MHINKIKIALLSGLIILLPQCNWFGQKESSEEKPVLLEAVKSEIVTTGPGAEVLLEIAGKPRITVAQFEKYMNTVLEAQPQLQQLLALMPGAERKLYESMQTEELLQDWIIKKNIHKQDKYQKDLETIIDFGKKQLAVKYFQEAYPVNVSSSEVKKYYEENKKTIPELMSSRGGANAQGAGFNTAAEAQAFVAKLQDPKANFAQLAKESKAILKDFKNVNDQSFDIEAPIREKLLSIKKFPAIESITAGDKTWVLKATGKSEPTYIPFEQIQSRLEAFLKQQKVAEMFNKELENLKKEFGIVEHVAYFDRKEKAKEEEMAKSFAKEKESAKTKKESAKPAQPKPQSQPAPIKGA